MSAPIKGEADKKDRWVKTRAFLQEFWTKNPGASTSAARKALGNARVDDPPFIIAEEHHLHLERLALKTNATPKMLSMQVHPTKPEIRNGPRPVVPPKEEVTTMAETKSPAVTEKEKIAAVAQALHIAMKEHGIESCILTVTTTPKPNVTVDVTYKKSNEWSIDL